MLRADEVRLVMDLDLRLDLEFPEQRERDSKLCERRVGEDCVLELEE